MKDFLTCNILYLAIAIIAWQPACVVKGTPTTTVHILGTCLTPAIERKSE